jgi:hypothetical protein
MWKKLKQALGRFDTVNSMMGEVVFETPEVSGQAPLSSFNWRLKEGLDDQSYYISATMRPDASVEALGSERSYISFDIASAERLRADLDACIAEYHRRLRAAKPAAPGAPTVTRG